MTLLENAVCSAGMPPVDAVGIGWCIPGRCSTSISEFPKRC